MVCRAWRRTKAALQNQHRQLTEHYPPALRHSSHSSSPKCKSVVNIFGDYARYLPPAPITFDQSNAS